MSECRIEEFRMLAVGYAVLRDLVEEVGTGPLKPLVERRADLVARTVGRAAIAAVEATAENQL
ncbi:hypothetical protein [Sphingopyxis macrogoltabida]|uniref:Uncharacterized protein n=1 Tax=Sphingopyxis macrogoltabida TaxID=33050 RepID=A0AAC8Z216_SPHMC|nr:hypothetical protein [Sphingopyxis macrogoltabida]ALJ14084.1 hypothetical protein LH19_14515 [Sphingopyxis macrogoltabida]AMU90356.1 hypothetical protein ATM17_15120 [Sphingopyxis macrogoltabida]